MHISAHSTRFTGTVVVAAKDLSEPEHDDLRNLLEMNGAQTDNWGRFKAFSSEDREPANHVFNVARDKGVEAYYLPKPASPTQISGILDQLTHIAALDEITQPTSPLAEDRKKRLVASLKEFFIAGLKAEQKLIARISDLVAQQK